MKKTKCIIKAAIALSFIGYSLFTSTTMAKFIPEKEGEVYVWQARYDELKELTNEEIIKATRELVGEDYYSTNERTIQYDLMFAQDLQKKGITNKSLIKDYLIAACGYNVSISRLRLKDPTFNIFFETSASREGNKLLDYYDSLVDKNWELPKIFPISGKKQKKMYDNLNTLFSWDYSHDCTTNKCITNSLKVARAYFKHPDFKKNYYCPNTTEGDGRSCFKFSDEVLGSGNKKVYFENKHMVKFMLDELENPNVNFDDISYVLFNIAFDKTPSKEFKEAFDKGYMSTKYPTPISSTVRGTELALKDRVELIELLQGAKIFDDEQQYNLLTYTMVTYKDKIKSIREVLADKNSTDKYNDIIEKYKTYNPYGY